MDDKKPRGTVKPFNRGRWGSWGYQRLPPPPPPPSSTVPLHSLTMKLLLLLAVLTTTALPKPFFWSYFGFGGKTDASKCTVTQKILNKSHIQPLTWRRGGEGYSWPIEPMRPNKCFLSHTPSHFSKFLFMPPHSHPSIIFLTPYIECP